jgi:hypothetical protein
MMAPTEEDQFVLATLCINFPDDDQSSAAAAFATATAAAAAAAALKLRSSKQTPTFIAGCTNRVITCSVLTILFIFSVGVVLPLIMGAIRGAAVTSYASNHNQSPITSKSVCDPSVSVIWRRMDGSYILLLGMAHISSSSAALAGQLVRETLPEGVFVELDP